MRQQRADLTQEAAPSCSSLVIGSIVLLSVWPLRAAFPQNQEQSQVEEIVVTGSRIVRTELESPSPVTVVGRQQLESATTPSIGDLLNEMPQLRTTYGLNNSQGFIGTAGLGALDLRGLGIDRTLVLVNGRRHVSSSESDTVVDVNSINPDMIERVEIITGANSAVYGADAVSGAVNFVLKENFEGISLRAETGQNQDGFDRNTVSALLGANYSDGRGHALVALSYADQGQLLVSDRGGRFVELWRPIPNPADGDTINDDGIQIDDGIPDEIHVPNRGFWAISENGTVPELDAFLADDGSLVPVPFDAFEYTNGLECGGSGCIPLDLDSFQMLQVPLERFTIDFNTRFNLSEDHSLYLESRYANVEARQQGQPSFDFGVPITVNRDNPYASRSLLDAMDAEGLDAVSLRRFNVDLGLRREINQRETIRIVAGFEGDLGRGFRYDVFGNYGRTSIDRVNLNNRIDERFAAATDPVRIDADGAEALASAGFIPDAAAGDIVCRSTLQEAQGTVTGLPAFAYDGCVPLDVLGRGRASDAALEFINSTALATAEVEQTQVQAVVSNPQLASLWAGDLTGVLGVEYREEKSFVRGDSLSALGNTFFNALSETRGEYDVTELFAEFAVPLARDLPAVRALDLELAGRASDYSTIGSTFTWEGRLGWQPLDSLRVRASVGQALRAPNIGDLFDPGGENFLSIDDPCDMENLDLGNAGRNVRIANCQALGIANPEEFDSLDEESIPGILGGNPELREETADTFTVGLVFTPGFVQGLEVTLDYWDIEIDDAIAETGGQAIVDRCVDAVAGVDNEFCGLVTRDGIGNIRLIEQVPLNLNTLITNGWDLGLRYATDTGRFGALNTGVVASFLSERTFLLNSEEDVDQVEGELGDPEWQINWRLGWNYRQMAAFAELRWIDSMYIVSQELLFGSAVNQDPNPDVQDIIETGSQTYVDLGFTYSFNEKFSLGLVVDNVFDEEPPFPLFGNDQQPNLLPNGTGALYDTVGRFVQIRASATF